MDVIDASYEEFLSLSNLKWRTSLFLLDLLNFLLFFFPGGLLFEFELSQ